MFNVQFESPNFSRELTYINRLLGKGTQHVRSPRVKSRVQQFLYECANLKLAPTGVILLQHCAHRVLNCIYVALLALRIDELLPDARDDEVLRLQVPLEPLLETHPCEVIG